MDKRNFKYSVLSITKIYFLMIIFIAIPAFILFRVIDLIFNGGNFDNLLLDIGTGIWNLLLAFLGLSILIYGMIGIVYVLTMIRRKKEQLDVEIYVRELPKYFPPAIVSFLIDLSLEKSTDYTATIAYLVSKKYIEIYDNGVNILNGDTSQLSNHEKYVFNCLIKKCKYNHSEFIKIVLEDAENMGLVVKGRRKINFWRNFGLSIVSFIVSGILVQFIKEGIIYYLLTMVGVVSEIMVFVVIIYSLYLTSKYQKENFFRTHLGNIETKRWMGVKKFLKDFTVIDQKELKDIKLYDDYIPYAIAMNEADKIEKYIEKNDSYRILIYGSVYNIDN